MLPGEERLSGGFFPERKGVCVASGKGIKEDKSWRGVTKRESGKSRVGRVRGLSGGLPCDLSGRSIKSNAVAGVYLGGGFVEGPLGEVVFVRGVSGSGRGTKIYHGQTEPQHNRIACCLLCLCRRAEA